MRQKTKFNIELAKIAKLVHDTIKNDDFTHAVKPSFLKDAVRDYPLRNGKRLRPALLIWSCGLFNGNTEDAKFAAAAVEIFHNWTLVHDDIIDGDSTRKGGPSTHVQLANFAKTSERAKGKNARSFGISQAILAGDIQHAWAMKMLLKTALNKRISPETVLTLASELSSFGGRDLICGEALDVESAFKKWINLSLHDMSKIAELKTGKLLQFCARCGARIALNKNDKNNETKISRIGDFAKFAGIAFQLKDDWLGVFADKEKIGKPILSDLSEKKPTSLFLETMRLAEKVDFSFIMSLAGKKSFSVKEISRVKKIISSCGAEKSCLEKASEMKSKALDILNSFPDCEFRKLLAEWTENVIEREK